MVKVKEGGSGGVVQMVPYITNTGMRIHVFKRMAFEFAKIQCGAATLRRIG